MEKEKDKYTQRMQRKKQHIDAKIAQANIDKGIVVLLTGNGKGKSSSAMGMICRALGYNMQVAIVRFLKGEQTSGEDIFLAKQQGVHSAIMQTGFTWNTQDKEKDMQEAQITWNKAAKFLTDETIDLVILDEITYMLNYKYLDEKTVLSTIASRAKNQHVIITGRAANSALINIADTVSEIQDIKHAFRDNIKAQKGVDY